MHEDGKLISLIKLSHCWRWVVCVAITQRSAKSNQKFCKLQLNESPLEEMLGCRRRRNYRPRITMGGQQQQQRNESESDWGFVDCLHFGNERVNLLFALACQAFGVERMKFIYSSRTTVIITIIIISSDPTWLTRSANNVAELLDWYVHSSVIIFDYFSFLAPASLLDILISQEYLIFPHKCEEETPALSSEIYFILFRWNKTCLQVRVKHDQVVALKI